MFIIYCPLLTTDPLPTPHTLDCRFHEGRELNLLYSLTLPQWLENGAADIKSSMDTCSMAD